MPFKFVALFILCFSIAACGGGSSSPKKKNLAPIVNAGADLQIQEMISANLSAQASDDGTVASVLWTQLSGANVTLSANDSKTTSFTAPLVSVITEFSFRFTATDDQGVSSSDLVKVTVTPVIDNPVVSAGEDQTLDENTLVTLTATATDNHGIASQIWTQVSGPTVSIDNSNSLIGSFTPVVATDTTFSFKITAVDNRRNSSEDTIKIHVNTTNLAPTANAGLDQIVTSGNNVILNADASSDSDGSISSYSWQAISGASGITLSASNTAQVNFDAPFTTTNTAAVFQLTVIDNRGAMSQDEVSITIEPGTGTITGAIKYENVPHTASNGLSYANSSLDPVRGADVELLDSTTLATTPVVLASTTTNHLGEYSFNNIPSGQSAIVRVKSTYVKAPATGEASWDMQVIDNTNSNAIYALDSSVFVVAPSLYTKNLTALSGWDSGANDYTTPRAAAPFHLLDRAYDMVIKIVTADADVIMPPVKLNWSIKNAPAGGDKTKGLIGTSHYTNGNLYILGLKDSDTDEYDGHVILHELGHYFEDKLSRADSIGGSHTGGDRLDMRVAFGEGFGNAWSGIISDDSFYRDSTGNNQNVGFHLDVENNAIANSGWYSEGSIQSILYDIYDSSNEVGDSVSLGFAPIYNVLIGAQKITPALTSIFSFGTEIKSENALASSDINTLLDAQNIVGSSMDIYGSTETNNAGNATHVTPIYTVISANGIASSELCSINAFGSRNKLSVFRFFKFTASITANYTFTASTLGASSPAVDPDIRVYKDGSTTGSLLSGAANIETGSMNLPAGNYIVEVSDWEIVSSDSNNKTGCFKLTITQ